MYVVDRCAERKPSKTWEEREAWVRTAKGVEARHIHGAKDQEGRSAYVTVP